MGNNSIGTILKQSLKIIDELAEIDVDVVIENDDKLEKLIKRAKELKKSSLWKLK